MPNVPKPRISDSKYNDMSYNERQLEYNRDMLLYEQAEQLEKQNELAEKQAKREDELAEKQRINDLIKEQEEEAYRKEKLNIERRRLKLQEQQTILAGLDQEGRDKFIADSNTLKDINDHCIKKFAEATYKKATLNRCLKDIHSDLEMDKYNYTLWEGWKPLWKAIICFSIAACIVVGLFTGFDFEDTIFQYCLGISIIISVVIPLIIYPIIILPHNTKVRKKHKEIDRKIKENTVYIPEIPIFDEEEFIQDVDNLDDYKNKADKYIASINDYETKLHRIYEDNRNGVFSSVDRNEFYSWNANKIIV